MVRGAAAVLFVLTFFLPAPAVRARITQEPGTLGLSTSIIEGSITDQAGQPIPTAQVSLSGILSRVERSTISDMWGWFAFQGVPSGSYRVTVTAPGYRSATQALTLRLATEALRFVLAGGPTAGPEISSEAFAAYEAGLRELTRRRPERAAEYLEEAVREAPGFAPAHTNLGVAYLQLRVRHKARREFEAAHDCDEESAGAHLGLGLIANDERHFSEAEEQLLEARRLDESDWRVDYELGRAYYGLNRFAEAELCLRAAAEEQPPYGNLYLLLANTLVVQEKYPEGLTAMKRFVEVAPDSKAAPRVKENISLLEAQIARR